MFKQLTRQNKIHNTCLSSLIKKNNVTCNHNVKYFLIAFETFTIYDDITILHPLTTHVILQSIILSQMNVFDCKPYYSIISYLE